MRAKVNTPLMSFVSLIMFWLVRISHMSSSYAKILGETNFRTREIPRSGSKAKDREKKKIKEEKNLRELGHTKRSKRSVGQEESRSQIPSPKSQVPDPQSQVPGPRS